MDPNKALEEIRQLISEYRREGNYTNQLEIADQLADTVEALDGWISNGGFVPAAWDRVTA